MTVPDLGRLESVDLRTAWTSEPRDFTPWLAGEENLALLGETLGLELEADGTEMGVGPFSADILCHLPGTEHWVLIENQLEQTDHTHLGQIITYAAGLDALTVIWVAARFVEEHRAALDWLNDNTAEGISFFGVEVQLWRIGDSPPAPRFNVVSKPNAWTKKVRESAPQGRQWDEESFFADIRERHPEREQPARMILEWAKVSMPDIWWGRGSKDGSFVPRLIIDGVRHLVIAVYTYGTVEVWFQHMLRRPPFDAEGKRRELRDRLNAVPGVSLPSDCLERRPNIPLTTFADPDSMAAFLAVLDWFVAEVVRDAHGEE